MSARGLAPVILRCRKSLNDRPMQVASLTIDAIKKGLRQREFSAAVSDYSDSLRLDPNQALALYNRAVAAQHLGRLKDAAQDRRRALALDPSLGSGELRAPDK